MKATKIEIAKLTEWLGIDFWGNYYYIPTGGFNADGVKKWLHTREGSMFILEAFWKDNVDIISFSRTGHIGVPEKETVFMSVQRLYGSSRRNKVVKSIREIWERFGGANWNWVLVSTAEAKTFSGAIYEAAINYLEEKENGR